MIGVRWRDPYWPKGSESSNCLKNKKPSTVGEVWTLQGFLSYYRSFIQDFSRLTRLQSPAELSDAAKFQKNKGKGRATKGKKGQLLSHTPITWSADHQNVVSRLIGMLTNPPILAYPDFNVPFVRNTDASNEGLGAVLYQIASHWLWVQDINTCREEVPPTLW